ncbi:MAG: carboxypeptidase-like regulatory domain-containing protein, partial [Bacteroidales bacterium]|nr:carboxypeptidase-like regulatory domain-containing protein [Bacteroidales bacterium]
MKLTKKTLLTLFLLTSSAVTGFSQHTISGLVSDKNTKEPLTSANVVLIENGKLIKGVATDLNGTYELQNLKNTQYIVRCSYSGYVSDSVMVDFSVLKDKSLTYNFALVSTAENLEAVKVTATVKQFEQDADKLIMNVDETAAATSTNAFDLLKKVPGVSIDNDENLKLNGQGGVLFQFDGRDMKLPWEALKAMLKG